MGVLASDSSRSLSSHTRGWCRAVERAQPIRASLDPTLAAAGTAEAQIRHQRTGPIAARRCSGNARLRYRFSKISGIHPFICRQSPLPRDKPPRIELMTRTSFESDGGPRISHCPCTVGRPAGGFIPPLIDHSWLAHNFFFDLIPPRRWSQPKCVPSRRLPS